MSAIKRKLRIALALDANGGWNSAGWGFDGGEPESQSTLVEHAIETCGENRVVHIVEVEVEFPTTQVIHGVLLE